MRELGILHVALSRRDGGAERQTAALAEGLARRGHRVLLLVRRGTPLERRAVGKGAPVFPLQPSFPMGPGGLLTWWSRSRFMGFAAGGEWDLVHVADPRTLAEVGTLLPSRRTNGASPAPVLVSWRGRTGSGGGARAALRRHERAGGWVHVASEALWSALVREGFGEDRLAVIHPGLPVEARATATGARGEARRMLGLPDVGEIIGTIAILDGPRGVDELIGAAPAVLAQRPGARIVVVGDGPQRGGLEARARASAAADRIHFTGWREDIERILPAFDVYAFTGRGGEVFPLSLVEAMAAGVPVVVCDQPGIREIIENGKQGLIVPGTGPEPLARTILRALSDGEVSRAMGRAGAVRVQRFTTRAMVDAMEQLCFKLARNAASP